MMSSIIFGCSLLFRGGGMTQCKTIDKDETPVLYTSPIQDLPDKIFHIYRKRN